MARDKRKSLGERLGTAFSKRGDDSNATVIHDVRDVEAPKVADRVYGVGDRIDGRYIVIEEPRAGAMGFIYFARDPDQDLVYAIKTPKAIMLSQAALYARVLREAEAWTELGMHPNIAYCYFVRRIDRVENIFVEYVDGGNLRDWIDEKRFGDDLAKLDAAIQFCHGMEHAHARGMLHRDIKPENILLTKDGEVKITDFGLVGELQAAERMEARGTQTHLGDLMGTPKYMAPEQVRDPRRRGPDAPKGVWFDSDVYSFGVCLWEVFCGARPRDMGDPTGQEVELPDGLPDGLPILLRRLVHLKRAHRPADFRVLREELNEIYRDLTGEAAPSYYLVMPNTAADELNNQGYSFFELGERDRAINSFRQAIQREPTHPQAVYNLALMEWRAGSIDDVEVLKHVLECAQNPRVEPRIIAELSARVHAERGDGVALHDALAPYPGRYEALFGDLQIGGLRCVHTLEGARHPVVAAAFTPDDTVLAAHGDATFEVWRLADGKCLRTVPGDRDAIGAVALIPAKQWALHGARAIECTELARGGKVRTYSNDRSVGTIASDGKLILVGTANDIQVWGIENQRTESQLIGHRDEVRTIAIAQSGGRAVSGSVDRTVRVWNLTSGEAVMSLEGHTGTVLTLAVTPDGRWALSGGTDRTLRLWNLSTGQCERTLSGHAESVLAATISSDGYRAVSGSQDGLLKIWDLATGECLRTVEAHDAAVTVVSFDAGGRRLVTGSEDALIKIWDLGFGTSVSAPLQLGRMQSYSARREEQKTLRANVGAAESLVARGDFARAHSSIMAAWQSIDFRTEPRLEAVYETLQAAGRLVEPRMIVRLHMLEGHSDRINCVALSSDGHRALSGSDDRTMRLWDLDSGQCLYVAEGYHDAVTAVSISPDGRRALSGSNGADAVILRDLESGQIIRRLEGHEYWVFYAALASSGRWAITGSWDETVKIWDIKTGDCLQTLQARGMRVASVVLDREGRAYVCGMPLEMIRIFNVKTGECIGELSGHQGAVESVALVAGGRLLVSAGADHSVRVWDVATEECVMVLRGHTRGVNTVVGTVDGRCAFTGSDDHRLILWDLDTGEPIRTLDWHTGAINAVAMLPNGRRVISAGADKTIAVANLIWSLEFAR